MAIPKNNGLLESARKLRKEMTPQEQHLWYQFLRHYSVRFHRQYVIGSFIVDFYCHKAKLVIELDGSQHFETEGQTADAKRDAFLQQQGLTVIRIPNNAIKENFAGVCEYIDQQVMRGADYVGRSD